ncbi:Alpha/Beta hydrolase protein [Lasiosphaeria hispida]|uniref:Alpha/Beta hydrolase protein n=1 Tax=Lasiosphaeria hispida TaxID=260671 RepID=A0AAJ0H6W6_9PEZI|nr:Alpha/Beta hydrolase protein [Lasiosphaeria hispida]
MPPMPPTVARFRRPVAVNYTDDDPLFSNTGFAPIPPQAFPAWMCEIATSRIGKDGEKMSPDKVMIQQCGSFYEKQMKDPRQTEDCLFLDVFVPKRVFEKEACPGTGTTLAPVVVTFGSHPFIYGHKDEASNGINWAALTRHAPWSHACASDFPISVSINYRLGLFGWFSDDPESVNAGLWDQRLALEWVQAHIEKFGGDPNRVTLVGQGAGAASIMHHVTAFGGKANPNPSPYNPQGTTPFSRAILISPEWLFTPNMFLTQEKVLLEATKIMMRAYTYPGKLHRLDPATLMKINREVVKLAPPLLTMFGPVVGGDFVPDHPGVLLRDGKFNRSLSLVVGHAVNDGITYVPIAASKEEMDSYLPTILHGYSNETLDVIRRELYSDRVRGDLISLTSTKGQTRLPLQNVPGLRRASTEYLSAIRMMGEIMAGCNARSLAHALPNSTYVYDSPIFLQGSLRNLYLDDADSFRPILHPFLQIRLRFLSFIHNGIPNILAANTERWPNYGSKSVVWEPRLSNMTEGLTLKRDDFDNGRCEWWTREGYETLQAGGGGEWLKRLRYDFDRLGGGQISGGRSQ